MKALKAFLFLKISILMPLKELHLEFNYLLVFFLDQLFLKQLFVKVILVTLNYFFHNFDKYQIASQYENHIFI